MLVAVSGIRCRGAELRLGNRYRLCNVANLGVGGYFLVLEDNMLECNEGVSVFQVGAVEVELNVNGAGGGF